MSALMVCIAAAALGGEVGWQPLPKGGVEYIIRIEPKTVESLRKGEALESELPAEVRACDVRHIRIVAGRDPLPHELPPAPAANPVAPWPPVAEQHDVKPAIPALAAEADKDQAKVEESAEPEPAKPWLTPWTLAATLLCCASLGGNLYLGWVAWGTRRRCRALLQQAEPQAEQA